MKTLITMMLLALSLPAMAAEKLGNEGANGGDEVALEFRQAFSSAVSRAQEKLPALYGKIQAAGLPEVLESAEILVVDEPLLVKKDGVYQDSIALNSLSPRQIRVNRFRWKETSLEIKEALALHEVASLAGLETTGKYPLSGEYLSLFRLQGNPQYDFTPACGRWEAEGLRRAEAMFEVGEVSRLEVTEAALELQRKLGACGILNRKQYCEVVQPMQDFVVEGLKWMVEQKMRGQFDLDGAIWQRDATREHCKQYQ